MKNNIGKLIFVTLLIGLLFVGCDSSKNQPPVNPIKFDTSLPDRISPEGLRHLIAVGDFFLGKTDKITTLGDYNGPSGSGCPSPVCEQKTGYTYNPDLNCELAIICAGVAGAISFATRRGALAAGAPAFCTALGVSCSGAWEEFTYDSCCTYTWHYDMYGNGRTCVKQSCWSE